MAATISASLTVTTVGCTRSRTTGHVLLPSRPCRPSAMVSGRSKRSSSPAAYTTRPELGSGRPEGAALEVGAHAWEESEGMIILCIAI